MSRVKLETLLIRRRRRLRYLRAVEVGARGAPGRDADRACSFVAVEALNFWTQYCRDFVIQCARGAMTVGGVAVKATTVPYTSRDDLLTDLAKRFGHMKKNAVGPPGGLQEPTWRVPQRVADVARYLGLANEGSIRSATSVGTVVVSELPVARNFAAHRCESTAEGLRQLGIKYGVGPAPKLAEVMQAPGASGGVTVASEWLAEIDNLCLGFVQ